MDQAGKDTLARAAFSADEDRGTCIRHLPGVLHDLLDPFIAGDEDHPPGTPLSVYLFRLLTSDSSPRTLSISSMTCET